MLYVTGFAAFLCLLLADAGLDGLLKRIEQRYNRAQSLQVQFEQSFTTQGRTRVESGELFLRKPGRMRWEYRSPAGKLFMSDGKYIYFYTPAANRVERSKLKESEDYRAPLAFLLGKLNFRKEFGDIHEESGSIVAIPKSDRLPYRRVEFEAEQDGVIRRLKIDGQDASTMQFLFKNERFNPVFGADSFTFKAPAGAEVVDAEAGN
jgi:outer membrane lipoprotein carrier protein